MNYFQKLIPLVSLFLVLSCENDKHNPSSETLSEDELLSKAGEETSSTLEFDNSSAMDIEAVFSGFQYGKILKQHIQLSMSYGKEAEGKYQRSLTAIRQKPEIAETLFEVYSKIPANSYLYRTMIVEALKEIRSDRSLLYLYKIADERIPEDTYPKNNEINTREDEVIIRITAVEGISILALQKNIDAEKALIKLIEHHNLTVRQMAVRGYLQSPFGDVRKKIEILTNKLPKEEHWYISVKTTNIKEVAHPDDMPDHFDLNIRETKDSPKVK